MELVSMVYWPIWAATLVMALAVSINLRTTALPNNLTLPFILSGWLLALLNSLGIYSGGGHGGVAGAVICTFVGALVFFAAYAMGAIGAGSVKLQMGFAAWVSAYHEFLPALGIAITGSFLSAVLLAIHWAMVRKKLEAEEKRWQLLPTAPAQFLGSVGVLFAAHLLHLLHIFD
jgi:Flp pilus assembly protein protease CpaA